MRKIFFGTILLAVVLVFPGSAIAGADGVIDIAPPPLIVSAAPPEMIVISETNVYAALS